MQRKAIWLIIVAVLVALLFGESVWAARNYYKVMGVDKEADERTIKRAYRVGQKSLVEREAVQLLTISFVVIETSTEATPRQTSGEVG